MLTSYLSLLKRVFFFILIIFLSKFDKEQQIFYPGKEYIIRGYPVLYS